MFSGSLIKEMPKMQWTQWMVDELMEENWEFKWLGMDDLKPLPIGEDVEGILFSVWQTAVGKESLIWLHFTLALELATYFIPDWELNLLKSVVQLNITWCFVLWFKMSSIWK